MEIIKETKYLAFVVAPSKGKTKVVAIVNRHYDEVIGEIRWFGRWRQYCFFPYDGTVWNTDCMESVQEVINQLKKEREI
jgi:hypothetical protein